MSFVLTKKMISKSLGMGIWPQPQYFKRIVLDKYRFAFIGRILS